MRLYAIREPRPADPLGNSTKGLTYRVPRRELRRLLLGASVRRSEIDTIAGGLRPSSRRAE